MNYFENHFLKFISFYIKIMPDKAFNRELGNLSVGCKYRKNNTCTWRGLLKDYQVYKSTFVIIYLYILCFFFKVTYR